MSIAGNFFKGGMASTLFAAASSHAHWRQLPQRRAFEAWLHTLYVRIDIIDERSEHECALAVAKHY